MVARAEILHWITLAGLFARACVAERRLANGRSGALGNTPRTLEQQFGNSKWSEELVVRQSSGSDSCQPQCSPDECGGSECLVPDYGEPDFDQQPNQKRALQPLNGGSIGDYLRTNNRNNAGIVGLGDGPGDGNSFCVQRTFSTLSRTEPSYIGTGRTLLTGCTVLTIVSARAVYMCHFWETLGFVQDRRPNHPPPDFQRNVLNLVFGGGSTFGAEGQPISIQLFNATTDKTFAFISTPHLWQEPQGTNPRSVQYPQQIGQLQSAVEQNIGPNLRAVITYKYDKPDIVDGTDSLGYPTYKYPDDQGYRGQALFEYDPMGTNGNPDWRLLMEEAQASGVSLAMQTVQKRSNGTFIVP